LRRRVGGSPTGCIAVVTSSPPLAEGGHLVIATALVAALRAAGHQAGLVVTPQNRFGRMASSYLATYLTDVGVRCDGAPIDQIISLRYPSYAVRHPAHVCWLNHRMREYYDLWPELAATLSARNLLKERIRRRLIHAADGYFLKHRVRRVFAQSQLIQARLRRLGGIPSTVLYPPPPQRPYRCDEYGDYVFVVSRLTPLKRVDLIIDALAQPEAAGVRCMIAGDGEDAGRLKALVTARGLDSRVRLLGHIDDCQLLEYFARCRAVCFPTFQEDYGLVTVEAFASGKAVITCDDSGGPAELVSDGINGFVCAPNAVALGTALQRVTADRALAERMGSAGYNLARTMGWESVVRTLLAV
jgi:glycosyltransferase involved in cell wall biosynthesis